jgi:hypothetical protein
MQERLARIIHECGLVNNPGRIPAFFNTPGTVLIRPSLSLYPASTFSARRSLKTKIFMAPPPPPFVVREGPLFLMPVTRKTILLEHLQENYQQRP